jgi:hypothetical protein
LGRVLDLEVESAEPAIAALARFPLVASTTQLGERVHVLLRPDAPRAEQAAARVEGFLAERGLHGARARPGAPDLEDVFVALLLGEHLDAEAA